jgi:HlyD family secretion protein
LRHGRAALFRVLGGAFADEPQARRLAEPGKFDLDDILAEKPPRFLRGPHYVIVLMLIALFIAAAIVRVDMIVVASGRLEPDGPPIVLQPLDRSVIHDIHVKVGDTVHKGDVLATLDATFTQADRASLLAQQNTLQAQVSRLEAELNDKPLTIGGGTPEEQLQLTLYHERRMQYTSRLQGYDEEVARAKTALHESEESRGLLSRQLEIAREMESMREQLFEKQTGSKLNYLEAQAVRIRAERDFQDLLSRTASLQYGLEAAQVARDVFVDGWRRELLEDLTKARAELERVTEGLAKAVRLNDLVVLSAPEDGIVLDVAKRSVGSVLHEAEPLITLIPSGTPLIVEIMIQSSDVGYTKLGDEVAIKVDAFPYQRHGLLKGKLRAIGEDSVAPGAQPGAPQAGNGVYHRSQVTLDSVTLADLPEGTRLIPGMTATAEIKVGSRTVLSYFLYPLMRGFGESIREP